MQHDDRRRKLGLYVAFYEPEKAAGKQDSLHTASGGARYAADPTDHTVDCLDELDQPSSSRDTTGPLLLAQRGYMFVNFLEVLIQAVQTNRGLTGSSLGLSSGEGPLSRCQGRHLSNAFKCYARRSILLTVSNSLKPPGVLDESVLKALTKGAADLPVGARLPGFYTNGRAPEKNLNKRRRFGRN